jgi:glycine/D-amino acid oxidase-like deaminating enzyme
MQSKHIIVIGAGIGGLTAAIHLAKHRLRVTVIEKNSRAVGRCDRIIRDLVIPANPSLYIHAPARLDADMSPQGQDRLIAIVPVGHMSEI